MKSRIVSKINRVRKHSEINLKLELFLASLYLFINLTIFLVSNPEHKILNYMGSSFVSYLLVHGIKVLIKGLFELIFSSYWASREITYRIPTIMKYILYCVLVMIVVVTTVYFIIIQEITIPGYYLTPIILIEALQVMIDTIIETKQIVTK
ncbi:hypothetical protein [Erysipelothrix aquatica]|uniref:hypothetical protein n=2 Tax=Erysipelothrix TaxID=1647 RepID=UPI001358F1A5|nr:hypothetical protein [Erysipelothrix aquatica]